MHPDDVFAVLGDGWLYPTWVVGASRMRAVDPAWPAEGAHLHHSLGAWPVLFDDDTQEAEPAALLTRRVVAPRPERLGAETPAEAVQICLDRLGRIDLATIAELLGEPPERARELLGDLVYDDPEQDGGLVHAPAYLSGSIYPKIEAARFAA